jgi:predicted extracellular nuclease
MRITSYRLKWRTVSIAVVTGILVLLLSGLSGLRAAASELFFSEYIEGSSNNKALEIYNGTSSPVNLTTDVYNVQMFFNGSASPGLTINLTGTVAIGDVFVLAQSSASAAILAQADQTNGAGWFNGDDAVVLRKGTVILDVIGQIGTDPGAEWGTGLTSTADNTIRRKPTICAGDTNGTDAFDPAVEWDGFATDTFDGLGAHTSGCGGPEPTNPSGTGAANPNSVETGDNTLLTVAVTPGANPTSTGLSVVADLSAIGGSAVQPFFDDGTNGDVTPGDNLFSYQTTVPSGITAGTKSLAFTITDAESRSAVGAIALSVVVVIPISEIQGSAHLSPLNGQVVATSGIVTAKATNGFWIQSQTPDGNDATSEGLFIFTSSVPTVAVGDAVRVSGRVTEFRPGGATTFNLTTTELGNSPSVAVLSSGNALPAPTVIGYSGRVPPSAVINDDGAGNVESQPPAIFDAAADGIDFYESLEGMRVQINDAVVIGPTNSFNETWVVGDNGVGSSPLTARNGILIQPGDFNPERIQLEDPLYPGGAAAWPDLSVGARLTSPAIGIVDYNFGNFEVLVTDVYSVDTSTQVVREVTPLAGTTDKITIATFNVENLGGNASLAAFATRANQIVNHLGSPDILVVEEIQDNDGETNSGVTDATVTFNALIGAIQSAGGPAYAYAQINPVDQEDGGAPGGNIRQGFLYNSARVMFNPRPGGDATTANSVTCTNNTPLLNLNPGRIDPTNAAFTTSRKPLIGEFEFNDQPIFVVGVHFNSKGGDTPLFGYLQPPVLNSEAQRINQATVVNGFVNTILTCAPDANVIVLGDMNDFIFSPPITTLKGSILHNLFDTLPTNQQYSYVFEGNSQVLDQMVVSSYLKDHATPVYDVVHVNAEFTDQVSDHDPSVTQLLPVKPITIDIRPFSRLNPINLQSTRKVTAAILGTADFSARSVDPRTVTLAAAPVAKLPNGSLLSSFIDINFDRRIDLVMLLNTQDLQLTSTSTEAVLLGKTITGDKIRGVDVVRIVDTDALMLVSPQDGTTVNTRTPVFEWDGDPDATCYVIEIDNQPNFQLPLTQAAIVVRNTQYQAFPMRNGTYYWRVQVGALCGGIANQWSDTWRVVVNAP